MSGRDDDLPTYSMAPVESNYMPGEPGYSGLSNIPYVRNPAGTSYVPYPRLTQPHESKDEAASRWLIQVEPPTNCTLVQCMLHEEQSLRMR